MSEADTKPIRTLQYKSIEQRTLETLERIEKHVEALVAHKDHEDTKVSSPKSKGKR